MNRYVVSHRLAGHADPREGAARSAEAFREALKGPLARHGDLLSHHDAGETGDRHLASVGMEEETAARLRTEVHPHVLVEPMVQHRHPHPLPVELHTDGAGEVARQAAPSDTYQLTVTGGARPVAGAMVGLLFDGSGAAPARGETSAQGTVVLAVPAGARPASVVVAPATDFWGVWQDAPPSPATVQCPPLEAADHGLGWWHHALGIRHQELEAGTGMTVGVLDTGLAEHPALAHVKDLGAFTGGQLNPGARGDVSFHGTYTCGVLGARPADDMDYVGIAPGARIVSARIYDEHMGCDQGDIALGIHALVTRQSADLVNLSLSADQQSEILHDAIVHGVERGVLCICSAGNAGMVGGKVSRAVTWPAAFPEAMAVAAAGREGTVPAISGSAHRLPTDPDQRGRDGYFLGTMSCFGDGLDCIAPGVGIISASPPHHDDPCPWVAMDGTSAASPAATGIAAVILGRDPRYADLPRDRSRAEYARRRLVESCTDLGLSAAYQGGGLPRLM